MKRRRIVVTGASRGIGAAIARELAEPGVELVLIARSQAALSDVLDDCAAKGATGSVLSADLSNARSAEQVGQAVLARLGSPDVLVLNAGTSNDTRFEHTSFDAVDYELGVNYLAPAALLKTLLPSMQHRRTSVVTISSLTVHVPFPGNATYAASKAAMFNLLRSLRLELRSFPVHLGAVLPGYTDTEMAAAVKTPIAAMSPARVARAVRLCIEERRDTVVPGLANRLAARLFRNLPELSDPVAAVLGDWLVSRPEADESL